MVSFVYLQLGTIMTISKDRVKPSPRPDSWKLNEIFATGIVIGTYLALVTVLFYWVVVDTDFFEVWNLLILHPNIFSIDAIKIYWSCFLQLMRTDTLSCKVLIQQFWGSFICFISSSQHHKPSSHICYKKSELVIFREAWSSVDVCICGGSTGTNFARAASILRSTCFVYL